MRILQITNRIPYPPKDGGAIGYYNFTKSYAELGVDLTLLSMNTSKHYIDIEDLPDLFRKEIDLRVVDIDNRIKPKDAALNLFTKKSYNIQRFESYEFAEKLIETIKEKDFDIIHLDSLFVCSYIPIIREHSKAKIVLRAHNVEYLIWERIAAVETKKVKKAYLNLLARRLKAFEEQAINEVDLILPISEIDRQILIDLGCKQPQHVVTAGIDSQKFIRVPEATEFPSIFHLGSLDWIPNQQAVKWFLNEVWNDINLKFPDLKLYIAGRNTPDEFFKIEMPNVEILGEVESAVDFINTKAIMIVPLLSGSGMRLKILEGMALGKTIISTSIGAEGIEYENNKNIIIADTPKAFVESISKCLNDKAFYNSIGENAWTLAHETYNNNKIVERLLKAYKSIL